MSEFLKDAVKSKLQAIVDEVRATGLRVEISNGTVDVLPAQPLLPAPAVVLMGSPPSAERRQKRREKMTALAIAKSNVCDEPNCMEKHLARGKCSKHYAQLRAAEKLSAKK